MNNTFRSSDALPAVPANPVNRLRWWVHLLIIVAYLAAVGAIGSMRAESKSPALSHTSTGMLYSCGMELLLFALVFGLAVIVSRASWEDLLLRWRGGFWAAPLSIAYSVALRIAVGIIMAATGMLLVFTGLLTPQSLNNFLVAHRPNVEAAIDISALRTNPVYFWLSLTLVSFVVAGLREELWRSAFLAGLRRLWPEKFDSRTGRIAAVALAAIVFGLAHIYMGITAVVAAGLLGFGLGAIMVYHRSIWPAVIAHGMFDATTMALLPLVMEKLHGLQGTIGH